MFDSDTAMRMLCVKDDVGLTRLKI